MTFNLLKSPSYVGGPLHVRESSFIKTVTKYVQKQQNQNTLIFFFVNFKKRYKIPNFLLDIET